MKGTPTHKIAILSLVSFLLLSSCCDDFVTEYWYSGDMFVEKKSSVTLTHPDSIPRQHFFLEVELEGSAKETGSYDCGVWVSEFNNSIEQIEVSITDLTDFTVLNGDELFEVQNQAYWGFDLIPIKHDLLPDKANITVKVTLAEPLENRQANSIERTSGVIFFTD